MEHPTPHPLEKAADGTAAREAIRLLALPAGEWTTEDLAFSESAQMALIRNDYPVRMAAALAIRHREAAVRLLQPERDGAAPGPVLSGDDRARKMGILRLVERIERDLRRAGGGAA